MGIVWVPLTRRGSHVLGSSRGVITLDLAWQGCPPSKVLGRAILVRGVAKLVRRLVIQQSHGMPMDSTSVAMTDPWDDCIVTYVSNEKTLVGWVI